MFRCSVKIKCFESPTFSFRLRNTFIVYKRSDLIATLKFKKKVALVSRTPPIIDQLFTID